MTTKKDLHELIDELSDEDLDAALRLLESLRLGREDALLRSLDEAPEDDEPLTEEDIAAIEQGKRDYREGRFVSAEEAKRRLLG